MNEKQTQSIRPPTPPEPEPETEIDRLGSIREEVERLLAETDKVVAAALSTDSEELIRANRQLSGQ